MTSPSSETSLRLLTARRHLKVHAEWVALTALVLNCYFARLAVLPVCGEESRWANAAREMIASGDWVVPRQQGDVFPERPPLGSWLMAVVGLVRGQVDLVAVRLPSAGAILLLCWLIYGYTLAWSSRLAAFTAAAAFATSGQVLMLGRFGESEAVFTLFTAGSLLTWHWAYLARRHLGLVWCAGYSLAALGALAKGLQAPVYFVAASWVFLALCRDWRVLLSAWHAAGIACFAAIVGIWLIPFARLEWAAIDDIWAGLAQDRFTTRGLGKHLLTYPFETMACLLPWSPLLGMYLAPSLRKRLRQDRPQILFVVVALAVTYPTVWTAALARGRYYMPLYPALAILIGVAVEQAVQSSMVTFIATFWRRFLRSIAAVAGLGAVVFLVASTDWVERLTPLHQSAWYLTMALPLSILGAALLAYFSRSYSRWQQQWAVAVVAFLCGATYVGAVINVRLRGANDLVPVVAEVKSDLDAPSQLVSFGRVYHRFAFSYDEPIRQVAWPTSLEELPDDVTYFCYDWHPHYDTDELRNASDSRQPGTTSGKLPFAWEKVAEVPCDPVKRDKAHRSVVIGRVLRVGGIAQPATGAAPVLVAEPSLNRPVRR